MKIQPNPSPAFKNCKAKSCELLYAVLDCLTFASYEQLTFKHTTKPKPCISHISDMCMSQGIVHAAEAKQMHVASMEAALQQGAMEGAAARCAYDAQVSADTASMKERFPRL